MARVELDRAHERQSRRLQLTREKVDDPDSVSDIRAIRIIFQEPVEEGPSFASSAEPHIDGAELECGGPVGRRLFEHGFEDSRGFVELTYLIETGLVELTYLIETGLVELTYLIETGRLLLLGIDRLSKSKTKNKGKGHLKHDC